MLSGEYPADTKNERSIRLKAKKFCIRDREFFYLRTNGSEVSSDFK